MCILHLTWGWGYPYGPCLSLKFQKTRLLGKESQHYLLESDSPAPRYPSHQTLGTLSQVSREKSPVSAGFLKGRVRCLAASLSPRPEEPLLAQEFTVAPGEGKEWGDSSEDQFPLRGGGWWGEKATPKGGGQRPTGTAHREGRLSQGTLGSRG